MTIKKTVRGNSTAAAPVTGGATIADRFKLDMSDPKAKAPAGKGTLYAVVAGCLALIVVGVLTYTLWQHWEFLMPA